MQKQWRITHEHRDTHKNDLGTWKWMILSLCIEEIIYVLLLGKTGRRRSGTAAVSTSTEIQSAHSTHTDGERVRERARGGVKKSQRPVRTPLPHC